MTDYLRRALRRAREEEEEPRTGPLPASLACPAAIPPAAAVPSGKGAPPPPRAAPGEEAAPSPAPRAAEGPLTPTQAEGDLSPRFQSLSRSFPGGLLPPEQRKEAPPLSRAVPPDLSGSAIPGGGPARPFLTSPAQGPASLYAALRRSHTAARFAPSQSPSLTVTLPEAPAPEPALTVGALDRAVEREARRYGGGEDPG